MTKVKSRILINLAYSQRLQYTALKVIYILLVCIFSGYIFAFLVLKMWELSCRGQLLRIKKEKRRLIVFTVCEKDDFFLVYIDILDRFLDSINHSTNKSIPRRQHSVAFKALW